MICRQMPRRMKWIYAIIAVGLFCHLCTSPVVSSAVKPSELRRSVRSEDNSSGSSEEDSSNGDDNSNGNDNGDDDGNGNGYGNGIGNGGASYNSSDAFGNGGI